MEDNKIPKPRHEFVYRLRADILAKFLSDYENRPYDEVYNEIKKLRSITPLSIEQKSKEIK